MDLYVLNLSETKIEDLEELKKIPKTNKLLFLTDEVGNMSCFFYPYLKQLKMEPEFYSIPTDEAQVAIAFLLGYHAAKIDGTVYLISCDPSLYLMIACLTFVEKGEINIVVAESVTDALSKKKTPEKKGVKTNAEITPNSNNNEASVFNLVQTGQPNEEKKQDEGLAKEYVPASPEFVRRLSSINRTDNKYLKEYSAQIEDAVKETPPDCPLALELQLSIRLGEEISGFVYPLISDSFEELWEIAVGK